MKNVLLLLAQGFEIYEAGVFIDIIGWNLIEGNRKTKLFTCGNKKEVNSSFGQIFTVDFLTDEVNPEKFDALAVPGGFEEYGFYEDAYSDNFSAIIKTFYQQKKIIASVCTGSLAIANAGVLKNKKGTTYNQNPIRQQTLKNFGVNIVNEPVVEDENIITGQNPAAAVSIAFLLLQKLTDRKNTDMIKTKMGFM